MRVERNSAISSRIENWILIEESDVDISFLDRQHRRRLSKTTQLALTAYHQCNPEHEPLRSVFASRYGEFVRTFGILQSIVKNEPVSPAAFSVSVHNTPSGIVSIGTSNPAPSSTVAANSTTVEAGFLEAATQHAENSSSDLIFVFVDEPLPDTYRQFRGATDLPHALGLRLNLHGRHSIQLAWEAATKAPRKSTDGVSESSRAVAQLLADGKGSWKTDDRRLSWEWSVG